jgi:TRAP-type mannitol/chloroaromatic compound transport system permease small subunit
MNDTIRFLDGFNEWAGKLAGVLCIFLVLLMFGIVLARDLFNAGTVAAQESVLWLHSAVFLLGLGYALKYDSHVRVDVLSQKMSSRTKHWVEIAGLSVLLLPLCAFMFYSSWDYVLASWNQNEGSNAGGLPALYLLKTLLLVSPVLLGLQAIAQILKSLLQLRKGAAA